MLLKLSNTELNLKGFKISETYGGVIEGVPNKEINTEIILSAKKHKEWGERKTLVIKPDKNEVENKLKYYLFKAWIVSYETMKFDGKQLVLVWFDEFNPDASIKSIIETHLTEKRWNKHAEGFSFFDN